MTRVLIELAIGDAYGATYEFAPDDVVAAHNNVTGYGRYATDIGVYTDDTQMTLALAELLADRREWTPDVVADKFVEVFRRNPRGGYATRFQAFLETVTSGRDFLARIRPDSDKSGAAMRVSPAGLLPSVAEVRAYASAQARVTHNTPAGVESAEAAALAVHYCHVGVGPLSEIAGWVSDTTGVDWTEPWTGKVGSKGAMAVRAALTALASATSMRGLLHTCVAFTGDVDTVAAIALAAASRTNLPNDLPPVLYDNLENGAYGRDYLRGLDKRLGTDGR